MTASAIQVERGASARTAASMVVPPTPQIAVSTTLVDCEWDRFLASTAGGHHVQTSKWARLKANLGWQAVRLIARDGGQIVGGAQLLIRDYYQRLRIGYLSKGPLFSTESESTVTAFLRAFHELLREQRLQCVIVQPPRETMLAPMLRAWGYYPVRLATFLRATTVIDLSRPLDEIMLSMRAKTRKSVRQSQQRGVQVRRGGEKDLETFYKLFSHTADRQGFRDYSQEYFEQLWKYFGQDGHVHVFVAEVDGKPVSAAIRLAYGDTVICKKRGWSGEFGNLRPNEALEWAAIQWAKQAGYRYYDFEGLPRPVAEAVLRGEGVPEENMQSPASYKLGYGGEVCLLPDTVAFFPNALLRWGHRFVYPVVADWPIIDRLVYRFKVR